MSLKENVDYIKKELSAEESFLENSIKTERFFKKYRKAIIGTIIIAILAVVGSSIKDYMNEKHTTEANSLFNTVLSNPTDSATLEKLKAKDKKLYDIALYMQDNSKAADVDYLKELAIYTAAIEKNNETDITTASQNQKFLLKDFAIFNKALLQAQNGKYKEAKESLKLIPDTSNVAGLAKMLEHFLLTK